MREASSEKELEVEIGRFGGRVSHDGPILVAREEDVSLDRIHLRVRQLRNTEELKRLTQGSQKKGRRQKRQRVSGSRQGWDLGSDGRGSESRVCVWVRSAPSDELYESARAISIKAHRVLELLN